MHWLRPCRRQPACLALLRLPPLLPSSSAGVDDVPSDSVLPPPQTTITLLSRKEIRIHKLAAQQQQQQQPGTGRSPDPYQQLLPAGASGGPSSHSINGCAAGAGAAPSAPWRLDRDEAASTFNQMRANLVMLCGASLADDDMPPQRRAILRRLRQLVVDLDAPMQGASSMAAGQGPGSQAGSECRGQGWGKNGACGHTCSTVGTHPHDNHQPTWHPSPLRADRWWRWCQ